MSGIVFLFPVIPLSSFLMCIIAADLTPIVAPIPFFLCMYCTRTFARARDFPVSINTQDAVGKGRRGVVEKNWIFFRIIHFNHKAKECDFCCPLSLCY